VKKAKRRKGTDVFAYTAKRGRMGYILLRERGEIREKEGRSPYFLLGKGRKKKRIFLPFFEKKGEMEGTTGKERGTPPYLS